MDAAVRFPGFAIAQASSSLLPLFMQSEERQALSHTWFKPRHYVHFDRRITRSRAAGLVECPEAVAQHAFLPFLSREVIEKRYRRDQTGAYKIAKKKRRIAYASHKDAAIFSYYAQQLSKLYEDRIRYTQAHECVTAYRRFEDSKSNIDFAGEVFEFIKQNTPCIALSMDIKTFFDALPHFEIKNRWKDLIGTGSLPDDHYAVYKAITRWRHIDRAKALDALDRGKTALDRWPSNQPLCDVNTFRTNMTRLIEKGYTSNAHNNLVGIPQGSPMSGIISNFTMLGVDLAVSTDAAQRSVLYRRYSDDIVLVGAPERVEAVAQHLAARLKNLGLTENNEKRHSVTFKLNSAGVSTAAERPLQYLGFTFDGSKMLIRSQTLAKAIRRMKSDVKSAQRAAVAAHKRGGRRKLFRTKLYARHSHLGPKAGMPHPIRSSFWKYTQLSASRLDSQPIKHQMRRHWKRLVTEIRIADGEKSE